MKFEINGISFPFGGISWNKKISTKEMFAHLLLFLESKRILINPIEMEKKEWCIGSVLEIKQKLISITEGMELSDKEKEIILNLFEACNEYLNRVVPMELPSIIFKNGDKWEDLSFDKAMKNFRNAVKQEIQKIEKGYKLSFTKIIPDEF
ncbi:hypothetical protein BHF69_06305 [Anaerostipes sp. 992a]|uniref:DUF6650 family protein n=1 Tax=Anaerostipes sp. 992a TaxID=1261637 RepID=UPI00095193E1|nr:DUF6650 family protein [Anaerostipes sp. 992a]OLR62323.1 hypothetical protein BHF69_06305 [Anaerostipes sp. 992a]